MNKILLSLSCILLINGCSSVPKKPREINEDTKFVLNPIKTELTSKCKDDDFPNAAKINSIFDEQIREKFCKEHKCVDSVGKDLNVAVIDLDIFYTRIFMGEGIVCTGGYANSTIGYTNKVSKNNVLIGSNSRSELVINQGLFGNLMQIGKQLTLTGDAENEAKIINKFTNAMAKEIEEDLQEY